MRCTGCFANRQSCIKCATGFAAARRSFVAAQVPLECASLRSWAPSPNRWLIDKGLRDEGTNHHCTADPELIASAEGPDKAA
jgi:hypothetical protein